jgi:hypothetical protein
MGASEQILKINLKMCEESIKMNQKKMEKGEKNLIGETYTLD